MKIWDIKIILKKKHSRGELAPQNIKIQEKIHNMF